MHLGHARTALVTWLRARQAGGRVVMRVEDLDPPRVRPGSAERIMADHRWLGLGWDEGPVFQSERTSAYETALQRLAPHLFHCSCTRRELREASAPHGPGGPVYPGTCYQGPTHPERPQAIRFRMTEGHGFSDEMVGDRAHTFGRDDFVVRRSDGLFAYQLAVVVDDIDAGVTEVVRGDDLLSSTPKQIALYRALGAEAPSWLHVPLVFDGEGERLAKRRRSLPVRAYQEAGWSPERLLGMLAQSLGVGDGSAMSLEAIAEEFSLAKWQANPGRDHFPPPA